MEQRAHRLLAALHRAEGALELRRVEAAGEEGSKLLVCLSSGADGTEARRRLS